MKARVRGIGQIAITVDDLDRAVNFYSETLNLELLFRNQALAFFNCDGIRLLLAARNDESASGAEMMIYYAVDDIQQAVAALREDGVTLEQEPTCVARMAEREVWVAFFRDSEGAMAALIGEQAATE
jgi:predicted enzyme related to lactoylglutathione lyase